MSHRNDCNTELSEFAAENDVLTLIHTDCTPFITSDQINELVEIPSVRSVDAVIKYSATAKSRSVLLAKGYFVFLEQDS